MSSMDYASPIFNSRELMGPRLQSPRGFKLRLSISTKVFHLKLKSYCYDGLKPQEQKGKITSYPVIQVTVGITQERLIL
jgi:hypothetical protein